jgi:hypothetical protein
LAIVGKEDSAMQLLFFKSFAFNNGFKVGTFTDIVDAENWLLKK